MRKFVVLCLVLAMFIPALPAYAGAGKNSNYSAAADGAKKHKKNRQHKHLNGWKVKKNKSSIYGKNKAKNKHGQRLSRKQRGDWRKMNQPKSQGLPE